MIKKLITYTDGEFEFTFEPIIETLSIRKNKTGFIARYLIRDDAAESPDTWGDDSCFLVHYHRDFTIERNKIITGNNLKDWYCSFQRDGIRDEDISQEKEYHIFPVAALIHSGVWLSLSKDFVVDPGGWDTSHVGAVLVSRKEWKSEKKAYQVAENLIKDWNYYLTGDVYTAVIEKYNKDKEHFNMEEISGIYTLKAAESELKEMKI